MGLKILSWLLLWAYVAFMYWATVFSRADYEQSSINWTPFWTYKAIANGSSYLIADVINNVVMFIPIGLLLSFLITKKYWWLVLVFGVVISITIELLQRYLQRGLCEMDDIIHNTIGCLLGLAIVIGLKYLRSERYV